MPMGSSWTGPRAWISWLLAIALVAVAAGCGGDDGGGGDDAQDGSDGTEQLDEGEPVMGGKIVYGLTAETDGYNPASNRWGPSAFNVARALYDPLTVVDPEGVAQPYLVESIEHCVYNASTGDCTDDGSLQEWTITLRDEEIRFHNGDLLTAEVLADFLKTMQLAPLTSFAYDPVQLVAVIDDRHLFVRSEEPWGTFPALLSGQSGYLVHPGVIDGSLPDPVGTGPFQFDEWVRDDHLTVVRNDSYWRDGLPYLDEIEFRPMADPSTRGSALEAGDVDLYHTNASRDLIEVGPDGAGVAEGYHVVFDGSAGDEQHMALNTQTGPTADPRVRRALALATDRQALVDGLYDGFFETADGPYDRDSFWWSDSGWPEPDADEATRLVDEYEAENGPLEITVTVVASQENLELGQAIIEQWQQVGIDGNVESLPESEFANALLLGDFQAIMNQFYNRSDPDEHYHFWDPQRIGPEGELSLNFPRWRNDAVAEALRSARQTADPEERKGYYATVWSEWAKEFPYLWLYHGQWIIIASDDVHGLESFTFPDGEPASSMDWGAVFLTSVWRT
jgi:ABC-type transport system substrate-binding protein